MSNARDLLTKFPDNKRHPLIAGSKDWDTEISPALYEFGELWGKPDPVSWLLMMRVAIETIYMMGYERGKAEKPMLEFLVGEE